MTPDPRRLRTWLARTRAAPARIDRLHAALDAQATDGTAGTDPLPTPDLDRALLDELRRVGEAVERAGQRQAEADLHVQWVAGELALLRQLVGERADGLDRAVAGQAAVGRRVATAAIRRQRSLALLDALGPSPVPRPGLSTLTVAWNHAGFLDEAVTSALAALDAVPATLQGEALVFDDASSDETPAVTDRLAALDPRVRVVRSPEHVGSGWGRNVLLHTATTTHAFQLDADNRAEPAGVAALFEVATTYDAASVYGTVVKFDRLGRAFDVMGNEPITAAFFDSNYVDTMAVVDVARIRAVGGWPVDPEIEHLDDWVATHALLRHGHLVGFVPVVTGRYRVLEGGLYSIVADHRIGRSAVRRAWDSDGRLTADRVAAFAAHPSTGPLWATPRAVELRPALGAAERPALPSATQRPRVLVVAPGGVGNVGDDAITTAVAERLRRLTPGTSIEVVTDGPLLAAPEGAWWRGTLTEVVAAPATVNPAEYLAVVFAGGGSTASVWREGLIEPRVALARRLRAAGVPYVMSGLGVGPLDGVADERSVAELVGGAERVALRDEGSADLCRSLGVDAGRSTTTGDDALGLRPSGADTLAAALAEVGVGDRPYLAVSIRAAPYVGDVDLERWSAEVDRVAAERELAVLGVALNDVGADPEAALLARLAHGGARRRAPWHVLGVEHDPRLAAAAMAGAQAAAVHSYHAALFALVAGRPVVLGAASDYYRRKAEGLARLVGLQEAFVARPGEPADLAGRLDAVAAALGAGAGLGPATDAVAAWWRATVTELEAPTLPSPTA